MASDKSLCLLLFPVLVKLTEAMHIEAGNKPLPNKQLEKLAMAVVEKYFFQNRCLILLSEEGLLQNIRSNNTILYLETDSEDENCVETLYNFFRKTFTENCDGYVVQFCNPKCVFDGWYETYKQKFIPRHNPKYFFLPVFPDNMEYAEDLFSMRISDISANILVAEGIQNDTEWTIRLSTNNFYKHPLEPGREPKIFLDEWQYEKGFRYNTNLYPDKVANLHRKNFRIATGLYLPYTNDIPIDGMENQIALHFCKVRNCTPVLVSDDYYWGDIDEENFTGNGVTGNVYADRADVGMMALDLWTLLYQYMDYSTPYHNAEVTVMTPKPERIGGWILPFMPFSSDVWIAFVITLFASALALYFITKAAIKYTRFKEGLKKKDQFTTLHDSILRAIALAVLQMPSSRLLGDSPVRYLFTSFEFLYLLLTAMYSAELASFLTIVMFYPPIDTFHDFAQSGLLWYAQHPAFIYALAESTEKDAVTIVNNFRAVSIPELKVIAKEGKYAFSVERLGGGSLTQQEHQTEDVISKYHIMKEPLYRSSLVGTLKKGGPYNKYYNEIVSQAVEHGLLFYWEAETVRKFMDFSIQVKYEEAKTIHVESEPTIIKLPHIIGILYIYFIGIVLSFIVFFFELIKPPRPVGHNSNYSTARINSKIVL